MVIEVDLDGCPFFDILFRFCPLGTQLVSQQWSATFTTVVRHFHNSGPPQCRPVHFSGKARCSTCT